VAVIAGGILRIIPGHLPVGFDGYLWISAWERCKDKGGRKMENPLQIYKALESISRR
jgi:hypothetical protein